MSYDSEQQRMAELRDEHRRLQRQLAEIAEYSAEVHEEAARVHERMPDARLDPEALRQHAQRDRELAARERDAVDES